MSNLIGKRSAIERALTNGAVNAAADARGEKRPADEIEAVKMALERQKIDQRIALEALAVENKIREDAKQRAQILASMKDAAERLAAEKKRRAYVNASKMITTPSADVSKSYPCHDDGSPVMYKDKDTGEMKRMVVTVRRLTIKWQRVGPDGNVICEGAYDWQWRGKSKQPTAAERKEIEERGGKAAVAELDSLFSDRPMPKREKTRDELIAEIVRLQNG